MAERAAIAAAAIVLVFGLHQSLVENVQPDFFIYRQGAVVGLRGESPYEPSKIRAAVNAQFPNPVAGPDDFQNNCGFFLPPVAVIAYAPFALAPWSVAKVIWAVLCAVAAFATTRLAGSALRANSPTHLLWVLFLGINHLALTTVQVGQTSIVAVGCIAFGLDCFRKNRPLAGALLWSVAFLKPHVALPLIPLAWYLFGWKRAAALVLIVGIENVLGALIAGGSPLFLGEYLDFLASGHKAVSFNLAERNYEITSWNRLLYVVSGYAIEQTAATTLAAYLIWFGMVLGRCAIANGRPSAAWAMAAAAAGSAFVPQVLVYEVLILALAVPWVRELSANGRHLSAGLAILLLAAEFLIPFAAMEAIGITFHRPLCTAGLALLVLGGPVNFSHVPASVQPPAPDR